MILLNKKNDMAYVKAGKNITCFKSLVKHTN